MQHTTFSTVARNISAFVRLTWKIILSFEEGRTSGLDMNETKPHWMTHGGIPPPQSSVKRDEINASRRNRRGSAIDETGM
ncbi:hypothetical protein NPIL_465921 [Nephila pilipes]|uniref:Uncharacterized protein n=1 Tax=Nephila pilipes TaxID=299642 RepID=A0A8X6PQF4_NEPPI|nr:hypothetical protein NPIL_465921 [Nephila pilipes]